MAAVHRVTRIEYGWIVGERVGEAVEMTVLFTDIEGSTRLWDEHPERASALLDQHDRLLRADITSQGGDVVGHTGDGMIGRFDAPSSAVAAAIAIQRSLRDADWGDDLTIKVRIGIHTGEVVERADGLFGWALNHCSRVMDVGHGGQVLLSAATASKLDLDLLDGVGLIDLGEYRLRDVPGLTRLAQLTADGLATEFPPLRKTTSTRRSIPSGHGAVFGREDDLALALQAVGDRTVVTLTGPPGVGKTRLAIEVARTVAAGGGPQEVLWSELVGIGPDSVIDSIMTAHAISVRPGSSAMDSLVAWLAEHRAMLVLDGCDESLSVVRALAAAMAEAATSSVLVATSQYTLGLVDETVVRLAPLDRAASIDVFLDRAAAGGAREIDGDLAAEIVGLLDDMPYAIEIAAANAAVFSPAVVRDALASGGLAGVDTGDARIAAVREAVGLAIDALDDDTRRSLVAATVFSGRFDARGFGAVCDPGHDGELSSSLATLVEASLLQPTTSSGHAMFRLLDPVRSAVAERSDRSVVEAARRRLCEHVVTLVGEASSELRGPSEQLWLRVLDRHFGEVRSVFMRAVDEGDLDTAAFLATELWEWALFRFNSEYFGWGTTLLERADSPEAARLAPVHGVVALGCWFRDELEPTRRHAEEAIRRERELGATFSLPARLALINATVFSGAAAPPPDVFADSDEYHRTSPDGFYRMNAEAQNAIMATWLGRHEAAEHLALKALKIARESGNPTSLAYAEWSLGQAIEHDDPERAEQLFDDALRLARDVDNQWVNSLVQVSFASSRRRTSGPVAAAGLLADLLGQLRRAGHWAQLWNVTRLVALCAGDAGDTKAAFELAAAVDAAEMKFPPLPVDAQAFDEMVASITAERGEAWTRRTAAITSTWTDDDVVAAASSALASIIESA